MRDLTLNEVEQVNGGGNATGIVDVAIGAAGIVLGGGAGLLVGNALQNVALYNFAQGTLVANAAVTGLMATAIPPAAFVVSGAVVGLAIVSHYMFS